MKTNDTSSIQSNPAAMKGSEIVIRCLELAGVKDIFAYPGGQSIEMHQALASSKIRVILPRHEQGGAFAADGYARATGRTGVCMATSGPGATNLITGIADAYMDSVPMVIITGQVSLNYIGKNAFQETDIIGITRPIVKHSFLVLDVQDIPRLIDKAFDLANSGRPGPVVVDVPKNIQQQTAIPVFPEHFRGLGYRALNLELDPKDVAALRREIAKSRRPCIYAGGGIITAGAAEELRRFSHRYRIPVATTIMGIGAMPQDDPLYTGWLGMHGCYCANYTANESDLLLAFGARFDDRVTGGKPDFCKDAYIVHVDIDQSEINKNRHADLGIVADVKALLTELNKDPIRNENDEWFAQIETWKKEHPLGYRKTERLQPQYVVETLSRLSGGNAVIVPGVGQHQMWAAQFYEYGAPRQFLTSGGLGSMGFGLPAAMGAKVACPEKTVIDVDGDGSFQMNIQELATLFVEHIGVKMVILNNQLLGMVSQWEDRFYGSRHGNTDLSAGDEPYPDFVKIAEGYGIPAMNVNSKEELEQAVKVMLEHDGPFLLDCHISADEHVMPMIPPGKTYKDMMEF